jgi:hypothetical protein
MRQSGFVIGSTIASRSLWNPTQTLPRDRNKLGKPVPWDAGVAILRRRYRNRARDDGN